LWNVLKWSFNSNAFKFPDNLFWLKYFVAISLDWIYTRKYMHAETLALLTKLLCFPNMKYCDGNTIILKIQYSFKIEKSPQNITFNYKMINFPNIYMLCMLLEIHACSNPSHVFSKHWFNMKYYSNLSTLERRLAVTSVLPWQHGIFFVQHATNSWKIIAFNYITMNFRNMYYTL
jgi:hypothetical protein